MASAPFATPQDLADALQRDVDTANAELLLGNASRILRAAYPWLDSKIADGRFDPAAARQVVVDMVRRALLGGSPGVTSEGLDGVSVSYDNALQNLFLIQADRLLMEGPRRLPVGSMRLVNDWLPAGSLGAGSNGWPCG